MPDLEQHEMDVIGQCLQAVAHGPFLADPDAPDRWWEFHSLMGLSHGEVVAIAERWPHVEITRADVRVAISNSMGHLLGYPHGGEDAWPEYIKVSRAEVERVLEKWLGAGRDNIESWRRLHESIDEYPDDTTWSTWKLAAQDIIDALERAGVAPFFRAGQAMHHIILSTLNHHGLRDEPRVTIDMRPDASAVRVTYSVSNIEFHEPIHESTYSVSDAVPGVLWYLRRLWTETRGDAAALPDAFR